MLGFLKVFSKMTYDIRLCLGIANLMDVKNVKIGDDLPEEDPLSSFKVTLEELDLFARVVQGFGNEVE